MANAEPNEIGFVSQVVRFAIVGIINTGVDLAVLNALIAISHRGRSKFTSMEGRELCNSTWNQTS